MADGRRYSCSRNEFAVNFLQTSISEYWGKFKVGKEEITCHSSQPWMMNSNGLAWDLQGVFLNCPFLIQLNLGVKGNSHASLAGTDQNFCLWFLSSIFPQKKYKHRSSLCFRQWRSVQYWGVEVSLSAVLLFYGNLHLPW